MILQLFLLPKQPSKVAKYERYHKQHVRSVEVKLNLYLKVMGFYITWSELLSVVSLILVKVEECRQIFQSFWKKRIANFSEKQFHHKIYICGMRSMNSEKSNSKSLRQINKIIYDKLW